MKTTAKKNDFTPRYFMLVPGQQYAKVTSETEGMVVSLYFSEVTKEFNYSFKTAEPAMIEKLLTDPGIYQEAVEADWRFAVNKYLNYVKRQLEKVES